jgi:hypothetical protein
MGMMIVLLSDLGDEEGAQQSYKVNIPVELENVNLNQYTVNAKGEWRKNGSDAVVAVSSTIVRAGGKGR